MKNPRVGVMVMPTRRVRLRRLRAFKSWALDKDLSVDALLDELTGRM
ncbi:MAG: hypothetical protein AAF703_09475 [Cyanobacteria bacterium P01_D01_bin.105]